MAVGICVGETAVNVGEIVGVILAETAVGDGALAKDVSIVLVGGKGVMYPAGGIVSRRQPNKNITMNIKITVLRTPAVYHKLP